MNVPMLLSPKVSTAYLEYNATLRQGVEKFRAHGYSAVPVLNEDGYYMGTVSEGDFLKYILNKGKLSLKDLESVRICDILRDGFNDPVNIDASIDDLIDRLMDSNFVPVVDGRGCFVGIVTRKRMLEYLRK
ncbi:MAG: CBS domain-containing protein [Clostridiales bacterium]|nr:CBS domain-containing protein [Clostridiales bacterium]